MLELDPTAWTLWTWCLYVLGTLYIVAFVVFYFRFESGERAARGGDPVRVAQFNAMLHGFPNAFYSKMLGKKGLEAAPPAPEGPPKEGTAQPPQDSTRT